ncbi:hypothetical protein BDN72DRAFT_837538 [Pluteus cervinus]|uniref:Uncharacterized protein n=1 Tax=Pluteus cervinus TaxID=181527 RepID=A0ACD3B068_9AGAR|nr:hypothetical protein BDN72DRAFT_837538 [Pluteus cervinus]
MQILDLPVENLTTILEFVRVADHADNGSDCAISSPDTICPHNCLISLSLVCSTLRPLAQREHFSHVVLRRPTQIIPPYHPFFGLLDLQPFMGSYLRDVFGQPNSTQSYHRFLDLITRKPIICSYVRGISLERVAEKQSSDDNIPWILPNANVLANILLRLPHLTAFHITTTDFVLMWNHIPENLLQAMYTVFQLPTLTTLGFTGFHNLPVDLLDRCPRLQNLHLVRSYFKHPAIQEDLKAPFSGVPPLSTAPSPQIRHLEIKEALPVYYFPFGCLNTPISNHLQALESFQMKCFYTDIHTVPINEFKHLKRLEFTCSPLMGDTYYEDRFIDLGHLHNLQYLDIVLSFTSDSDTELLWVANTLNSLPTPNRTLRSVAIRLKVSSPSSGRDFDFASFNVLSRAFSKLHYSMGTGASKVLRTVTVDVVLDTQTRWDPVQVKSGIAWLGCGEVLELHIAGQTGNMDRVDTDAATY